MPQEKFNFFSKLIGLFAMIDSPEEETQKLEFRRSLNELDDAIAKLQNQVMKDDGSDTDISC